MCLCRDAIVLIRLRLYSPRSHSLGRFLRRTNCTRSNYFYNSNGGVVINLRLVTSTREVFEKLLNLFDSKRVNYAIRLQKMLRSFILKIISQKYGSSIQSIFQSVFLVKPRVTINSGVVRQTG